MYINLHVNGADLPRNGSAGCADAGMSSSMRLVIIIQYITAEAVGDTGRTINTDMPINGLDDSF